MFRAERAWTLKRSRALERGNEANLRKSFYRFNVPAAVKTDFLSRKDFWEGFTDMVGPLAMGQELPYLGVPWEYTWNYRGLTVAAMEMDITTEMAQ
jgi:hypothetical protein